MKPIRKFLARHVWLLFLLILGICVGGIALIACYPWQFTFLMGAIAILYLAWSFLAFIGMITYHLYMKWSLEE